jgi:phosphatidate cytidylyltransferase
MTKATDPLADAARADRKAKNANLAKRFATAGVAVPFILWMLLIGPSWVWAAFVLAPAQAIAAQELFAMVLPGARGLQAFAIASTLAVGTGLYFTMVGTTLHTLAPLVLIVWVLGSLLVSLAKPVPNETAGVRMAWLVAGPLYIGGALAALAALHRLPHGGAWVILSMMLAWFADTAGYFAGRFLGGKVFGGGKMSPNISPNKTWEGAAGAVFGGLMGVLLAHFWYLPDLPLVGGIGLALASGPIGVCGDLVESLIKRSTGTKDSGWIVPGHGGLIDRIDALMFTCTVTLVFARVFLYG